MQDLSANTRDAYEVVTECHRYAGRVAIVTGAARGLGRVIARRLAQEGAQIVIADLDSTATESAARALKEETGSEVLGIAGDLSHLGTAEALVDRTLDAFGRVDALVNNAAALVRVRLVDASEELIQAAVDGNVWTTLRCSKAVLPAMIAQHYGRIVNIGGEAWRTGMPFHTLLAGIGKGAIVGLTATLAGEVVTSGITVNCVSPAGIDTDADGRPLSERPAPPRNPAWTPAPVLTELSAMLSANPAHIGRLAHPTEVAAAVAFLASPEASYITGQHVGVSGGTAMI